MVLDLARSRTGTARGQQPEHPQGTDTSSDKGPWESQGGCSGGCEVWGGGKKAKRLDSVKEGAPGEAQQPPRHPRADGRQARTALAWKGTGPRNAPGACPPAGRALLSSGDLGAALSEAALSALKGSVPSVERCSRAPKSSKSSLKT